MAFDTRETSVEQARPIELYTFQLLSQTWRWTSHDEDVTFQSLFYEAIPIFRDKFAQGTDDRDGNLGIHVHRTNPVALLYRDVPPPGVGHVSIVRFHEGDTEPASIWRGLLTSVSYTDENEKATLHCRPEFGTSSRPIPRFTYGGQCQHVFGDALCGVVLGDFTHEGDVYDISADGRTLSVTGLAAEGADFAKGGRATFGQEHRQIQAQSGDDITILVPFRNNPAGSEISVVAGCPHTPSACALRFNNGANFGGFPFVPYVNPAAEGFL